MVVCAPAGSHANESESVNMNPDQLPAANASNRSGLTKGVPMRLDGDANHPINSRLDLLTLQPTLRLADLPDGFRETPATPPLEISLVMRATMRT